MRNALALLAAFVTFWSASAPAIAAEPLALLFLGDNGHHRPADRFAQLAPVLADRDIDLKYTDDPAVLTPETLSGFDGLVIYSNLERITPDQEKALLDFVAGGKGFIPLHCASYCFLNSQAYVDLVGAQFQKHGAEVFSTVIARPDHPVMQDFGGFRSFDETYVHHRHNEGNRSVLEYREQGMQADGRTREPWTWVRTHGKGRVFYTAWGHDQRTWSHAGFQNLVERGIRWACGQDPTIAGSYVDLSRFDVPEMTSLPPADGVFKHIDVGAKIPNYIPSNQWGTQGDPLTKMQLPLSPEVSRTRYSTPVGFELRLFASEPELAGKPIAMNWDARGRLWVCETVDYPNELADENHGRDRIRICEDTDGDGRADRFTVFAEDLSIPTAVLPCRGGAIVQNGTETLFLKDTDGDDKADLRTVLISNWNLRDTHGGVSNFHYGLDNWIWAMQGYNNSAPVINGQEQTPFRMGFFRFRLSDSDPPTVTELEFLRSTDNNTWGLGFSEEGLVFGSTANHNPSVFMPIPNRYYEQVRGWSPSQLGTIADSHMFDPITENIRQVDHHGGYTAGAGHALYTARQYPSTWWNRTAFVCGPTGHLVGTFVLSRDGAGYNSTSPCNLVASDDEWSAPIMAEVGPDGTVWILDWYNYIVQHNPTPRGFETGKGNAYESDLRDKKHGRIYRLVYVGDADDNQAEQARGYQPDNLPQASSEQLVAALTDPTLLHRKLAQRLLVERGGTDVVPQLIELIHDESTDAIGLNVGAIHALWTLKGLGTLDDPEGEAFEAAVAALEHRSAGVRRNAAQVLPAAEESAAAILAGNLLSDADAQVRLAAMLALADMPEDSAAGRTVAERLTDPGFELDRWTRDALTAAAAAHARPFLSRLTDEADEAGIARSVPVARIVAEHIARGRPESDAINSLVATLSEAHPQVAAAIINGLAEGWPRQHQIRLSSSAEEALISLLDSVPTGTKGQVIRLASLWGSSKLEEHAATIVKSLLGVIGDDDSSADDRIAAARNLIGFRPDDEDVVEDLLDEVTAQMPPELATGVIEALSTATATNVGSELIDRAPTWTPAARQSAMRVLLARPETTRVFLDAVEAGDAQLTDLTLDQKQALASYPDRALRRRAGELLLRGGSLPNPDRQKVIDELLPVAHMEGSVEAGQAIFKKHCAKCHRFKGEGEKIGPDLTGMAVHPKEELLIHILDPSRSVEGNFRAYTVLTDEGRVYTGMLAGETRTSIEIVDTEAKRHSLQRSEIEELIASRKSVMPEGFEKQVSKEDLANLLTLLTDRGKYFPLDMRKASTIVSTRPMFYGQTPVERLIFPDWSPKQIGEVPFYLVDPQGDRQPNVIMLRGPLGRFPPQMPQAVTLPVNAPVRAFHMLGGISGWGHPATPEGSTSMIVRLHYKDGEQEDHELKNGIHFADYVRRIDVPESEFAFDLDGRQLRYLTVEPRRTDTAVENLELIKGSDNTAPIVMAITAEVAR
ncbi:Trehalose utilization [Maioricimonas rarisocia]|uniref:Trehalose utilization n=1 Tax=Maioricimonas rarisocia TaxID=2528026 RepID=A0A517ZC34_9PLAN|nr:PVC-type heme-binding CxxCH protein [Maioricimonas rarisocia]QDU40064.1 Trehalose utilization [Maioricimonas rarisocia]